MADVMDQLMKQTMRIQSSPALATPEVQAMLRGMR